MSARGGRALNLNDAIAALDAGEIQPAQLSWPGVHPDALVGFQARSEDELDLMLRPPAPTEPPPLPGWAEPWAELLAEKLKPVLRAEIRAALKAEAGRKAQEPRGERDRGAAGEPRASTARGSPCCGLVPRGDGAEAGADRLARGATWPAW